MGQPEAKLLNPGSTGADGRVTVRAVRAVTDEQWQQVCESLRAFIVFGGVGARTRRAAGALVFLPNKTSAHKTSDLQLRTRPDVLNWWEGIGKDWREGIGKDGQKSTPTWFSVCGATLYVTKGAWDNATSCHEELLKLWREFRQDRNHPAGWGGATGWGRSRWPEADMLRIAHGTYAIWSGGVQHMPDSSSALQAPRAHLGLPINVKFKDTAIADAQRRGYRSPNAHPTRGMPTADDPPVSEIKGQSSDRYASPVVLSILKLDEGYLGLILVTPSLLDGAVVEAGGLQRPAIGPWTIVAAKLDSFLTRSGCTKLTAPCTGATP
jgi:hypothetical protein